MRRFLVCLSFKGTAYCGWQVQKNCLTIQQVVQNSIEKVLKFRCNVVACSRTDSGVHANRFFFHFDSDVKIEPSSLQFALNSFLPGDISIRFVKIVSSSFHARYSAKKKEYVYKIWNNRVKNPFLHNLVWNYYRFINLEKIELAKMFLIGTHNFTSFCRSNLKIENKIRTIYEIDIKKYGDLIVFTISGNGFLHNMVRIIIGTLIEVSEGLIDVSDIQKIIRLENRNLAGRTVPACGLYLNNVFY